MGTGIEREAVPYVGLPGDYYAWTWGDALFIALDPYWYTAPKPNEMAAPFKPGLACDPVTLKCIENCKAEYTCTSDYECPTGLSCMPITVGNDATSFKACKAVGSVGTGGVKCDTMGSAIVALMVFLLIPETKPAVQPGDKQESTGESFAGYLKVLQDKLL